jgi:hypothetical protein
VVVTNADGSKTTTTATTQTNADGSQTTTTTKVTEGVDGSKTVTQDAATGKNAAGTDGKQDTPSDDKANLCKQNPTLTVCRNSTVSGTCGQISCMGDAIQCETLRAAAKIQCQQQADIDELKASPLKATGEAILSGAGSEKATLDALVKGDTVDLSAPKLDAAGFVPGSCLGNKTFTVLGRSVSVSFAQLCSDIQPLRYVIMACAAILSYLIVARSVLAS